MDSLQNILAGKKLDAPDEVKVIKTYLITHYDSESRVKLERGALIVFVPGSALAATLQLDIPNIVRECKLKNRLVIRIGR